MGKHSESTRRLALVRLPRGRSRIVAVVAALLLGSTTTFATVSAFTDTASTNIPITAGSINLMVNRGSGDTKTATWDLGSNMAPGQTIAAQPLTLKNTGTTRMSVNMTSRETIEGGLGNALRVRYQGTGIDLDAPMATASLSNIIINPGASVTMYITPRFPLNVPNFDYNSYMGKSGRIVLTFNATSV